MGEDNPSGEEKKDVAVDFHFSLWKLPLLHFDLMWSAGTDLESIPFQLSITWVLFDFVIAAAERKCWESYKTRERIFQIVQGCTHSHVTHTV